MSFSGVDNRLVDRSAQKETCQFTDIAYRPEIDNRLVGQSFSLENRQFTEHMSSTEIDSRLVDQSITQGNCQSISGNLVTQLTHITAGYRAKANNCCIER